MSLLTGLDRLAKNPELAKGWGRCGLVSNQASTTADFVPAWKILNDNTYCELMTLFGPQHGFESTVQENMIESDHSTHIPTGLKVYSLYSETREPTEAMLSQVDTIVVDLQVTGCRIYTYKYTLAACLRAANKYGRKVVVLDRHNPLGGVCIEGNVLEAATKSFVGEFEIPIRHGLTMGEAAKLFNLEISAELEVVSLDGWDPTKLWSQYQRPWVLTSPNLPILDTVYMFPGMVLLEGTNISEGRGTCLPFLFIGAPYIKDSRDLIERTKKLVPRHCLDGFEFRPTSFMPAFHKWHDEVCEGFQLHITNPERILSYRFAVGLLRSFIELSEGSFEWRQPPYEYDYKSLPIEILIGSKKLPQLLDSKSFNLEDDCWYAGVNEYIDHASKVLLYDREMKHEQY